VPVMNEVQFPFPSEPRKPLKLRSLYVVLLIEEWAITTVHPIL
jgi:hypothetical protein